MVVTPPPFAAERLAFGAPVEFASMEILASVVFKLLGPNVKRELLTAGTLLVLVGATVVVVALLLPVVAELLAFVAPVEFVSMETPASIIVELLGPAPNVKRVPLMRKIVSQKIRVIMTT